MTPVDRPGTDLRITVAICTWNRCDLLRQTLEQMTRLIVPSDTEWELLVVNNNCTDATDDVIGEFDRGLPVRRLFEPRPGISNARNLAIQESAGEYIVWTDDDVLVDPSWLSAYGGAFRRHPDAAFFGGPIRPWFVSDPPAWLTRVWPRVQSAYAIRDLGDRAIPLRARALPFGANMAMRLAEQRDYLYDPEIGYKEDGMLAGEETAVMQAMMEDGASGWWVPEARVRHYVPPERQTEKWLRSYFSGLGERLARQEDGTNLWFGRPRWMWRQVLEAELKYWLRRPFCRAEVWFEDLKGASIARGGLRHRQARESP